MECAAPHVAVVPSPAVGLLNPLLELSRCLVAVHGVHVTFFLITTDASPRHPRELLAETALPRNLHIVELPEVHVSGDIPKDALTQIISVSVRGALPSLRAALLGASVRPAALVVDLFGTDAFDVADELGVPSYLYFTTSASLLAQVMHLPVMDKTVTGEFAEYFREAIPVPGCKSVPTGDLVDPLLHRQDESYAWFLHQASRFPRARGILVNTWEGLEPAPVKALREEPALVSIPTPPVFPVGPLTKLAGESQPKHACMAWLDAQPEGSVLFVSFGSRGTLSAEQTAELALGLERTRQRFLWVARRPTGAGEEATVVKEDQFLENGSSVENLSSEEFSENFHLRATGVRPTKTPGGSIFPGDEESLAKHLPEGFLERTQGWGLVVPSWAPQVAVLSHPAVGQFLTHAGWNSAMEAIVHGVPMIAWPLYAEQKMNASMLEDLQVAVRVRPGEKKVEGRGEGSGRCVVERGEVEKVVRLVMEGDEGKAMRERVRELSRGAMRALEEGGSSYAALAEVVLQWKINWKN